MKNTNKELMNALDKQNLENLDLMLDKLNDFTKLFIYQNLDLYFRTLDVENYVEEHEQDFLNITMTQSDYKTIAQNMIDNYDCNLSFNTQLENAINDFLND